MFTPLFYYIFLFLRVKIISLNHFVKLLKSSFLLFLLFTTTLFIFFTRTTWKSQDSIFSIISIIIITIISLFYGHRGTSTISIISTIINIYYSINVVKMWSNLSNDLFKLSCSHHNYTTINLFSKSVEYNKNSMFQTQSLLSIKFNSFTNCIRWYQSIHLINSLSNFFV